MLSLRRKGKAPSSAARRGDTKDLLWAAAVPGRAGGAGGARWSGGGRRAALAAEPRGSPAIRGGRGGGDPGAQGAPAAGKLRLRLPSKSGAQAKGKREIPSGGEEGPAEGGGWEGGGGVSWSSVVRWWQRLPQVGPCGGS